MLQILDLTGCRRFPQPSQNVSIDEGTLLWRGRLSFRVDNPQKPVRYGSPTSCVTQQPGTVTTWGHTVDNMPPLLIPLAQSSTRYRQCFLLHPGHRAKNCSPHRQSNGDGVSRHKRGQDGLDIPPGCDGRGASLPKRTQWPCEKGEACLHNRLQLFFPFIC